VPCTQLNDLQKNEATLIHAPDGYTPTETLRAEGDFTLLRCRRDADCLPVLVLAAPH
jgi:hypothetical protein